MQTSDTRALIERTSENLTKLLLEKNRRYGDTAFVPMDVFSRHVGSYNSAISNLLVRVDDKLGRVRNGAALRKNDVADIIGYLILLCVSMGWEDFDEFLD